MVLKVYLSRKPPRKVRAVEVPFGGSKHKNSFSALKSAIHVKSLLSDLLNLLQSTFNLLSTTLRDLKGGRGSIFCALEMVGILVFLSVASPQLQGSQLWEGGGNFSKKVLNWSISCLVSWFPCILLPAGRKISNLVDSSAPSKYQICVIPTSEVKLEPKKKSD